MTALEPATRAVRTRHIVATVAGPLTELAARYWTGDRSPQELADLVVRDAGRDSRVIGHNIEALLRLASGDELAALMEENAGVVLTAKEATEQLGELVARLGRS